MYIVEKFDSAFCTWHYMNSFKTYRKAAEGLEQMRRLIPGEYRIREII